MNLNVLKYFPVMPEQASDNAFTYDLIFWWITLLAVFFATVVIILVGFLALKYRRGSTADRRNPIDHSKTLEYLFIGVPTVLALFTFWWSMNEYIKYRTMPKDGIEVYVVGKQWMWHLQHTNGVRENNKVHIPVDTNVKFTMISQDVIHAFYLPEFRAQFHVVPGRYTELYIKPKRTGTFRMLCAMHCGTQHSEMVGQVVVMSKKDYAEWLANGGDDKDVAMNPVEAGKKIWDSKNCGSCHASVDTTRGPSLVGIFGKARPLEDGTQVADSTYVRDSILTPWRRITKGYDPTMPAYQGQLVEDDILSLIAYIKSLSNTGAPGSKAPYAPTAPGGKKNLSGSGPNSTERTNASGSAGMTQFEEGASKQ